jgi:hypothetical protein
MVRDDHVDRRGTDLAEGRDYIDSSPRCDLTRCLVRFDANALANIEMNQDSSATTTEIEAHVTNGDERTEPTGRLRPQSVYRSKLPGSVSGPRLPPVVRGYGHREVISFAGSRVFGKRTTVTSRDALLSTASRIL